jgi:O-antigen ligase
MVLLSNSRNASKLRRGYEESWSLITTGIAPDTSVGIRWKLYQAGFQVGLDHPLAGVGLGAAREAVKSEPVFMHFMEQGQRRSLKNWQGDLHGGWAESFAELGVPGFLLFIVPVFMALAMAVRYARAKVPPEHAWGPAVLAAVLTWLAFGMFNVVYSSGQLQAMAMFAVTLAIGAGAGLFTTGTGMQRHAKVPHEDNT